MNSFGQVTWSDDMAQIFYDNCTSCHRPNGIGPFSLMTYEEASLAGAALPVIVSSGFMPPWTADSEYQEYSHERTLTSDEIIAITEWVNTGMLEGNVDDAPPPPVYPEDGFISATPDIEVQIPEYTSQASLFADDYVCFALPLGLTEDKKLKAFEVIPGNPQIVHHALAYIDPDATYETDLSGICGGPTEGLIGGYTPGSQPTVFPSNGDDLNMGVTIPAGSNLVLAMHYPEGSAGEIDDTSIRLFFYEDEVDIREITTNPIIQNWTFNLPANEVTEINANFGFIPDDKSLLSVFPHMHLLGKDIISYGVTSEDDTIPFVSIPHWDFEWQQFYFFRNMIHIPAWTSMEAYGTYDNTVNNPHNPNDPPIDVGAGLNTSDEMFLVYFQYADYVDGDEDIDLEELTALPSLIDDLSNIEDRNITVLPNPFSDNVKISTQLSQSSKVSISIYDIEGKLIDILVDRENYPPGEQFWTWKPDVSLGNGLYFYSMRINGEVFTGRILRQ